MDIDDDLLALAEGTSNSHSHSHKRKSKSKDKSSKGTAAKRRKASAAAKDDSASSDMDMSASDEDHGEAGGSDHDQSTKDVTELPPKKSKSSKIGKNSKAGRESEEDDEDSETDDEEAMSRQFPLEGKYKDEADRARIMAMTELEREEVLGERSELLNAEIQRRNLRRMVKAKEKSEQGVKSGRRRSSKGAKKSTKSKYRDDSEEEGETEGDESGSGKEMVKGARDRKVTGATKEKSEGLAKLRRRREEKEKGKKSTGDKDGSFSPPRRHLDDGYSDDSESEEGELDPYESRSASSKSKFNGRDKKMGDVAGPADLREVLVPRSKLAAFCAAPWFSEWIKGAWVRYLVGPDEKGELQYRLCQVESVLETPDRPYHFENGVKTDLRLELRHSDMVKHFTMEGISNSLFTDKEFARLSQTLTAHRRSLPSQKEIHRLKEKLDKRREYVMTEADLAAALAKKGSRLNGAQSKAKLIIQRDFARSTGDTALLAEVSAQLTKLEAPPPLPGAVETEADRMKRVNERNRASNREEIKRAEARGQDERRKQAAAIARGDNIRVDPSARVKTMTRLKYDRDTPTGSRAGTPGPGTPGPGTPNEGGANTPNRPSSAPSASTVSPIKSKAANFEASIAHRVQVDIDLDF